MSDTDDTSTTPATETPEQAPVHAPQPVDPPQAESSPRGRSWFTGGWRIGIMAAVLVVVAGAFFTIGWFTSDRGHDERSAMIRGIHEHMNMGGPGGWQRGTDQRGMDQRGMDQSQGHGRRNQGTVVPQQQQGQSTPSTQQDQSAQQGYLGVGVATVTPRLQQQYGLSVSSGVVAASIDSSGPASLAGIRQGDVITSLNGTPVTQAEAVVSLIAKMNAGDPVSVVIDRNGQSLTLQVTLAARPASISG